MSQDVSLRRALTVWLVRQRVGKAASTRHYYRETVKQIRRVWKDRLGKSVAAFGEEDVTVFSLRAGHYSASRWNGMLTVLHAILPGARTLRRRKLSLTRPPPPTQAQFAALLAQCDSMKAERLALVVRFLAHTGLRIAAARGVRWLDVFPDRIEYVAKGGRRCAVPIVHGLAETLDSLRLIQDASGFVLPRETIRFALAKACARAGVRRLSHHDFRHLFATRCIESGVDVPTVARWLGHRDGGALLSKRYFHLLDGHSRSMAARVRIG